MEWIAAGKDQYGYERHYCTSGNYVFKKKKRQTDTVTIYEIWKAEEQIYNTFNEFQFNKLAAQLLRNGSYLGTDRYL